MDDPGVSALKSSVSEVVRHRDTVRTVGSRVAFHAARLRERMEARMPGGIPPDMKVMLDAIEAEADLALMSLRE